MASVTAVTVVADNSDHGLVFWVGLGLSFWLPLQLDTDNVLIVG